MPRGTSVADRGRRRLLIVAMVGIIVLFAAGARSADACDACVNRACASGFDAGTYGCTEVHTECGLLARLLLRCRGDYCSTAGNPPCDERKKDLDPEQQGGPPHRPEEALCPATPVAPQASAADGGRN